MKLQIRIPNKDKADVLKAFAFETAKPQNMSEEDFLLQEIRDFIRAKTKNYRRRQIADPQVDVSDVAEVTTTEQ